MMSSQAIAAFRRSYNLASASITLVHEPRVALRAGGTAVRSFGDDGTHVFMIKASCWLSR
jgi:hypothetical protein